MNLMAKINHLRTCLYCKRRWLAEYDKPVITRPILKDYFAILKTIGRDISPLDRQQPWLSLAAIDELDKVVSRDMRVLEYGSGGSTLYFARHCKSVVSIEHDAAWCEMVRQRIAQLELQNVTLRHVLPVPSNDAKKADPDTGYGSTDEQFQGMSFEPYVHAADDLATETFDIIFIDGRARPACMRHATKLLSPGGVMIVDNAERPAYARHLEAEPWCNWRNMRVAGPSALHWDWSMTHFVFSPRP